MKVNVELQLKKQQQQLQKKTLRRKLLKFVLYSVTCIETILKYRRGEGHQRALFLFPLATFILTRLGEQCIYIWGCVLWFLHNYRVVVLRLGGVLEVYGGGHEGTSPPEPLTIRHAPISHSLPETQGIFRYDY